MEITFQPTLKQDELFNLFDDPKVTQILYGGAAGGGKSYAISALILLKCLQHPGIRVGLARNELTNLKKTTAVSLFECANDWGLLPNDHYEYNTVKGEVKFFNGSEIVFCELAHKPSDSEYTRLGGLLLTFGVIDEAGEVEERGVQIFKSRLGRWKNLSNNIKPMLVMTCNPTRNWLYRDIYIHYRDNTLDSSIRFIPALVTDNPYLTKDYIKNLETLPFVDKQRLLVGNWDYDSDPNQLMEHQDILEIFNNIPLTTNNNCYLTADIAFTSDKCVLMLWKDMYVEHIIVNPEGNLEDIINNLCIEHKIPSYNVAYDSDGVGKFLSTRLKMAKAIINNGQPVAKENYKNLKTQLYYKLTDSVNKHLLKINPSTMYKNQIIEELTVVKHKPSEQVGKLEIQDKGYMKRLLGRSPDFADCLAYRMIFNLKLAPVKSFRIG